MNADRPRYVLDSLLAHILETEAELVAHLIVNVARNVDSTRIGERLQPRRHVDAVAINIIVVADDIADIDSNAELDASSRSAPRHCARPCCAECRRRNARRRRR